MNPGGNPQQSAGEGEQDAGNELQHSSASQMFFVRLLIVSLRLLMYTVTSLESVGLLLLFVRATRQQPEAMPAARPQPRKDQVVAEVKYFLANCMPAGVSVSSSFISFTMSR